ncbi:hypothetical protein RhiirA4_455488 [Rhizophagus irregularis]|uniref:Uncharacterized protein n=1 Tax=Rhizophagus irregularis TaxID=588596 RepID=A0A2I1G5I2_9GLOM|nr:hypothetical protein RhiirA4_455488 [Rhizophagus irregularis]
MTIIIFHVWTHNRVTVGTSTTVTATKENRNWDNIIAQNSKFGYDGYSLTIPDDIQTYWPVFEVHMSTEHDKWRGPFQNDGDKCWHFHDHLNSWEIWGFNVEL